MDKFLSGSASSGVARENYIQGRESMVMAASITSSTPLLLSHSIKHTWKAEEVRVPNAMLVLNVSAPPKTFLTVIAPY